MEQCWDANAQAHTKLQSIFYENIDSLDSTKCASVKVYTAMNVDTAV